VDLSALQAQIAQLQAALAASKSEAENASLKAQIEILTARMNGTQAAAQIAGENESSKLAVGVALSAAVDRTSMVQDQNTLADITNALDSAQRTCAGINIGELDKVVDAMKRMRDANIVSTVGSGVQLGVGGAALIGSLAANKGNKDKQGADTATPTAPTTSSGGKGLTIAANAISTVGALTSTVASTISTFSAVGMGDKLDSAIRQFSACKDSFKYAGGKTVSDPAVALEYKRVLSKYNNARNKCMRLSEDLLAVAKKNLNIQTGMSATSMVAGLSNTAESFGVGIQSQIEKKKTNEGKKKGDDGYMSQGKVTQSGFTDKAKAASVSNMLGSAVGVTTSAIGIAAAGKGYDQVNDARDTAKSCQSAFGCNPSLSGSDCYVP
jgi:hypothetical protein